MKIGDAFPSRYLKAADLEGKDFTVTIEEAVIEEIKTDEGKEDRLILYFRGAKKTLVCNVTNANSISELYGEETDDWIGKKITLFPTRVQFGKKMTDAIRIRPAAAPAPAQAPAPRQPAAQYTERNPPPHTSVADDMDDEIPF